MDNAILYAGVDELNTIKEHVLELEGYQERNDELLKEETRLEKLIGGKQKEQEDEIETTLKKRRSELVSSYESQLATLNSRIKKVKAKKDKAKNMKVSERISEETAELREANKSLALEIKAKMKADKTPKLCNTTLFSALFMPKSLMEILMFMLGLLLLYLAVPFGIYHLFFAKKFGEPVLAIIYLIIIFFFGGLYVLISNKVKEKHLGTLREIRDIRHKIKKNSKAIRDIQKGIRNDSDESTYGLEQYDAELSEAEEEIRRVAEEEKEALNNFENTTAPQLTEDIKNRYKEELASLRASYDATSKEQKKTEEKVKEFTLMLSKQYEAYLGKDALDVAKLDRMISRIQKGEAATIGEALALESNR